MLLPQVGEVEELEWFDPGELPGPLMPPNIPALEKYAERKNALSHG